ncbi:M23 family metallopeptidase [Nocardia brevicatena]|uniref:M23 family metallopeptidase n=1 Tax=Nocardia brevicatena TaxID=37327 RepID=UPI0005944C07|nr:M23 family metallopeptidase [Nocardia brevicatena]
MSLIGDEVRVRPTRHRAEVSAAERVKAAAGAAVAAGALIGTAAQVAPAIAYGTPLLPDPQDADKVVEAEPVSTAEIQAVEARVAEAQAAQAAPAPAPQAPVTAVAAEIAERPANPAPFGLQNLPPEVAAPLAHAERTINQIQQQIAPASTVRPVAGAISSGYGSRWGAMHYGLDFADSLGAPIHAVSSGTVIEAGPASGFGLWVRVQHDDGTQAVYGHVNEMFVQDGQRVNAGDVIATVGNRGQSTGPHLHLEIWDQGGNKIDPRPWLAARGVPLEWGPSY